MIIYLLIHFHQMNVKYSCIKHNEIQKACKIQRIEGDQNSETIPTLHKHFSQWFYNSNYI